MPLTFTTLGQVLLHIYQYSPDAAIYLLVMEQYEADTRCIVASPATYTEEEENTLHHTCLSYGFTNWLNVAVVSDTCDDASEQTEFCLIVAFNEDCQEGGWLWKMKNYRRSNRTPQSPSETHLCSKTVVRRREGKPDLAAGRVRFRA